MIETSVTSWGNVNPVQFVHALSSQHVNDFAAMGQRLREIEDEMHERTGGDRGRSLTNNEAEAFAKISAAAAAVANALIFANAVLCESVAMPEHDGGPDVVDGAVSNGVLV